MKVAVVSAVVADGPEVMLVSGGVVSAGAVTVHVKDAGVVSALPAASVA